jgi:pyridinium-3,5-bisthiocarboxylic acid mononucleotide nickel chelatase
LLRSGTLGVRQSLVERRALPRESVHVDVHGERIAVKVATLPDGTRRTKPEFEDVRRVAAATGRPLAEIARMANELAGRK